MFSYSHTYLDKRSPEWAIAFKVQLYIMEGKNGLWDSLTLCLLNKCFINWQWNISYACQTTTVVPRFYSNKIFLWIEPQDMISYCQGLEDIKSITY